MLREHGSVCERLLARLVLAFGVAVTMEYLAHLLGNVAVQVLKFGWAGRPTTYISPDGSLIFVGWCGALLLGAGVSLVRRRDPVVRAIALAQLCSLAAYCAGFGTSVLAVLPGAHW